MTARLPKWRKVVEKEDFGVCRADSKMIGKPSSTVRLSIQKPKRSLILKYAEVAGADTATFSRQLTGLRLLTTK